MKKAFLIVFCIAMVFCIACNPAGPDAAEGTPVPGGEEVSVSVNTGDPANTVEAGTDEPFIMTDTSDLPLEYYTFDEAGYEADAAKMFDYDFDRNGTPEEIGFKLDRENRTCTVLAGTRSVTLEEVATLDTAIITDLDPESPRLNLLVVVDAWEGEYSTVELHIENGALTVGKTMKCYCWMDDNKTVWFSERGEMLGTQYGDRTYHGDDLVPDTEWLFVSDVLNDAEIDEDRESLIESGFLMELMRDLPCTVDGQNDVLKQGDLIYLLRFRETGDAAEVRSLSGKTALITFTCDDGFTYKINGVAVDSYFENLYYQD